MILPEYPFAVQNRRVAKYRSTPGVDGQKWTNDVLLF